MVKSPRRLKQQVQDTVGEQVRDLPLHAVRLAMFGVGRALLLSDRVTKDYKEITEGGGVKPVLGRLRNDVQHTAEKVVTGVIVRVRGADEAEEPTPARATAVAESPAKPKPKSGAEISVGKPKAAPAPGPEAQAKPAPSPKPAAKATPKPDLARPATEAELEPRPEVKPAAQAEAENIAADLPVPNYDEATLPQLRARLRGLTADQVKLLREYERKHAARADVLRMYENRIAKLNGTS